MRGFSRTVLQRSSTPGRFQARCVLRSGQAGIDVTRRGINAAGEDGMRPEDALDGTGGLRLFRSGRSCGHLGPFHRVTGVADHNPAIDISVEYRPKECRAYPSMADAVTRLPAIREAGQANPGITLDLAHSLDGSELPGHAASLIARHSRLPGIHRNDGTRDDGLMVAGAHTVQTVELQVALGQIGYSGVIDFDTLTDQGGTGPVAESGANISLTERPKAVSATLAGNTERAGPPRDRMHRPRFGSSLTRSRVPAHERGRSRPFPASRSDRRGGAPASSGRIPDGTSGRGRAWRQGSRSSRRFGADRRSRFHRGMCGEGQLRRTDPAGARPGPCRPESGRTSRGESGMDVAIVGESGSDGAIVVPGVNCEFQPPAAMTDSYRRVLCLQNELPTDLTRGAARTARKAVAREILNAARPTDPALLELVGILAVNRVEPEDMTGEDQAEAAARVMSRAGMETVILTLGAGGQVPAFWGEILAATPAVSVG